MPLCFVIGPIGKDGTPERKHSDLLLHAVIKDVLTKEEFNYTVKRADEDADPGMIGDRVVSDIINAELVVADLTDLNPNAFYELGIRHSTEKPTIHIARLGTPLPFDNVSHRTIFVDLMDWQSTEQARKRLAESARATMAPGYKVSNPITQANASFKMRMSDDPKDKLIAQLQERIEAIETTVRPSTTSPYLNDLLRNSPLSPTARPPGGSTVKRIAKALEEGPEEQAALDVQHVFPAVSLQDAIGFVRLMRRKDDLPAATLLANAVPMETLAALNFVSALRARG